MKVAPVERPLVILSDVHLGHRPSGEIASDLARLIARHPGHEVVLNGDTFNLSWDCRDVDPADSVASTIDPHVSLRRALAAHVSRGDRVTLVAGNHDADVQRRGVRDALNARLDCQADAPLAVEPWFIRRDGVHIEHGHVHRPDNAPAHPLAPPGYRSEPVGVAIVRRFLARHPDVGMLDREEATPLENLRDALGRLGFRAPGFVGEYLLVLAGINAETAQRSRLGPEREQGEAAVALQADSTGVARALLDTLLDERPIPTHTRFGRTFMRLYFDRITAAAAAGGGALIGALANPLVGVSLALPAVGYLALSARGGRNRYGNRMAEALGAGAAVVRNVTGADVVCFGHTHEEAEVDGYFNSGAFGDPSRDGRPFVHVDESGRAERRRLPPA